jgi:hypothetical protein
MERIHDRGRMLLVPIVVLLLAGVPTGVRAQTDLENALKQYGGETVKGYIQPIADMFGANMHAGYFHSAEIPKSGFHLELDFIAMGSMVGDDQKTYMAPAPVGFSPAKFQTATIFGGKGSEVASTVNPSLKYKGSDGIINTTIFPLAVPQLTIGYLFGTEASIRFITVPKIGDNKIPDITLWGIGVRHNISQYIPMAPLDLAAGFSYNSFTFGNIIDFKGLSFGAQASKSFSVFTLYGGLAWEKSSMNLKYASTDPAFPASVDITLDGANSFRFTLGAGLKLAFFSLFADANFGSVTNFSGGIGFGF